MQRKVDRRMLLVDHQVLGHIVHYAHDLVYLAVTADHLGTKVNRAGHGSLAAVCFVISNLEALPKCVPPFPQDAHEFLADDHVPGAAGFIFPPETPPARCAGSSGGICATGCCRLPSARGSGWGAWPAMPGRAQKLSRSPRSKPA